MSSLNLQISAERSTSQKVAETLRRAIFRGELKLGERLVEASLAKTLNVSITPVRQAFTQLAIEGLIHVVPYKGTNVIQITESFIEEVYGVRTPLELTAVELSLSRLDASDCGRLEAYAEEMETLTRERKFEEFAAVDIRFHGLFYERSGNALLLDIWKMMQTRIQLLQTYGRAYSDPIASGEVRKRHMRIVEAIRRGDLAGLTEMTREHIENGKATMLAHFAGKG